jgi:hypothetical protein
MSINIERILLELELLPKYDSQIMLQTVPGCNDHQYGVGSLLADKKDISMDERISLVREIEKTFSEFLFDKLVYTNSVIKDLGLYRTRVMKMSPLKAYSYHMDPTERIHIPLITNENCFFVIEDKIKRLPADGNHYHINTTKKHTFVNASFEERIHIVGCTGENHAIHV